MHLNGTKFIIEEPASGIGNKKEDFYTMIKTAPYYAFFGLPTEQGRYPVDKSKYKKQQFMLSEYYLMTERGINKMKLPLVITGNENKEFIIPELKKLHKESKLEILDVAVLGKKGSNYINKLISENSDDKFHVLDPSNELQKLDNTELIQLDEVLDLEPGSILINNAISEINKLDATNRRKIQEEFESREFMNLITLYPEPTKFKIDRMAKYKKDKKFIFTEDIENEAIQEIFKFNNRKAQSIDINDGEAIQVIGKAIKKIKIGG